MSGFSLVFLNFWSGFSLDLAHFSPEYKVGALLLQGWLPCEVLVYARIKDRKFALLTYNLDNNRFTVISFCISITWSFGRKCLLFDTIADLMRTKISEKSALRT